MTIKNITNMREELLKETDLAIAGRKELKKIEEKLDDIYKEYKIYSSLYRDAEVTFKESLDCSIQCTVLFTGTYRGITVRNDEEIYEQIEEICDEVIEKEIKFFKSIFEAKKTKNRKYIKTDHYMGQRYDSHDIYLSDISSATNKIYGILGKLPIETKKEDIEGVLDWGEKIKANDMIFKFYKNGRLDIDFLNDEDFEKIENVLQEV